MKRFVSVLLVAMLVVASMSFAAFAAEPGDTVTIPVTVNGPIGGFKVQVQSTDVLTVTDITAGADATINKAKGIVVWSGADNVNSYTFNVTVKIADDAAVGTHYLNVTVKQASQFVGVENDTEDGVADGWILVNTTASGSVTIEAKPTEPDPTEPDPTEPDPTEPDPTEPDPTEPDPTEPKPTEPKPTEPKPTEPKPTEPEKDPVPETGDITDSVMMTGALVLVLMAAAVAFVFKRRTVK